MSETPHPDYPPEVAAACQALIEAMRANGMEGRMTVDTEDDASCPNCRLDGLPTEWGQNIGFASNGETREVAIIIHRGNGERIGYAAPLEIMRGHLAALEMACDGIDAASHAESEPKTIN